MARPMARGREPSGPPREVAPLGPGWMIVLGIVARVGLALLVTAGFASALALYAGLAVLSPNMIRACEGVFLWTLALVSFRVMRMSDLDRFRLRPLRPLPQKTHETA